MKPYDIFKHIHKFSIPHICSNKIISSVRYDSILFICLLHSVLLSTMLLNDVNSYLWQPLLVYMRMHVKQLTLNKLLSSSMGLRVRNMFYICFSFLSSLQMEHKYDSIVTYRSKFRHCRIAHCLIKIRIIDRYF